MKTMIEAVATITNFISDALVRNQYNQRSMSIAFPLFLPRIWRFTSLIYEHDQIRQLQGTLDVPFLRSGNTADTE